MNTLAMTAAKSKSVLPTLVTILVLVAYLSVILSVFHGVSRKPITVEVSDLKEKEQVQNFLEDIRDNDKGMRKNLSHK